MTTKTPRAGPRNGSLPIESPPSRAPEPARGRVAKRLAMAAATAFITANVWTGCPLLALWAGSAVVGERQLSMQAVGVVVVVLVALELASLFALARLNDAYDKLIGRPHGEQRPRWLRSMRAEPEGYVSQRVGTTILEVIVVLNVYIAMTCLAVWWLFFSPPPLVAG
jgi:hypothetical protein